MTRNIGTTGTTGAAGAAGMNRREFLRAGAGALAAGAALTAFTPHVAYAADAKPMRVGLIGTGWYGKTDLFRLIQVAPVEVVSACATWTRRCSRRRPR